MSIGLLILLVLIESLNSSKLLSKAMPDPLRLTKIIVFSDPKI